MMASDRPVRNANATPMQALAIISTTTLGPAAPMNPNTTAPQAPATNIRFMPYLSPSTPAPSTEAASVRVASDDTKMVVPGENCSPLRTMEMFAARIRRSPTATALPSPMATVVIVAANPVTCPCRRTRRC